MRNIILSIVSLLILGACQKEYFGRKGEDFGPPIVRISSSARIADSITWITLSGLGSRDAEGMWGIIDFRWDIGGDGSWETPFTNQDKMVYVFRNPGRHKVILEVADRFKQTSRDSLEIEIYGAIWDTSHMIDPRDGQIYKTVKIKGIEWMAENLNYGKQISVHDTVSDNELAEKFSFLDDPLLRGDKGGYYTFYDWMEVRNYDTISNQGICPDGWELPSNEDWDTLIGWVERPLWFFAQGGFSNLNLSRMGVHVKSKEWKEVDFMDGYLDWTYFSRDYYKGYLNGPNTIMPYLATSNTRDHRGNIYLYQYYNDSIRKYSCYAPVRCIRKY